MRFLDSSITNHVITTCAIGNYLADIKPGTDLHNTVYYCIALLLSFATNTIVQLGKEWLLSRKKKQRKKKISAAKNGDN